VCGRHFNRKEIANPQFGP